MTISPSSTVSEMPFSASMCAVVGVDVRRPRAAPSAHARLLSEVGLDHARVRAHLVGLALGDLLAVVEHGDALGDAHDDLHVVLDQQDRQLALVAQLPHELRELRRLLRVHAGGRLVEQQQLGLGRQRPRDLHPALVAVGEVDRRAGRCRSLAQADVARAARAPCSRAVALLAARPAAGGGSSRTARPSCARAGRPSRSRPPSSSPNRRMFWNVRATPSAVIRSGPRAGDVAGRRSVIRPDGRLVEAGEHVEERRLAGAVGPDDRDDRALAGSSNETSSTATRPPKTFVTCSPRRISGGRRRRRGCGCGLDGGRGAHTCTSQLGVARCRCPR